MLFRYFRKRADIKGLARHLRSDDQYHSYVEAVFRATRSAPATPAARPDTFAASLRNSSRGTTVSRYSARNWSRPFFVKTRRGSPDMRSLTCRYSASISRRASSVPRAATLVLGQKSHYLLFDGEIALLSCVPADPINWFVQESIPCEIRNKRPHFT